VLIAVLLPAAFPLSGAAQDLREAARLDAEGKCSEADRHYEAALAKAPDSPVVLNKAGNHYLICGQPERAEALFTRLLRRDPSHRNAIVQLARLAVERRQGAKALEFLSRLKAADPVVLLLKAEALYWAGRKSEARRALETTEQKTGGDPRLLYLLGLACGRMGEYERAERAFQQALSRAPGDFEILFQLGRAAARAGNYDRARRALETALRMRPSHVDVLVELGKICIAQEDYSRAVFYLAQARQRAPEDAEIVLLLARAAEDGGYYDDAASAYDEYLRLRPGDDAARRDRARACGHTHSRREEARKELEWYLRKHPDLKGLGSCASQ
jgi:Flp pilus assembly protein TadD